MYQIPTLDTVHNQYHPDTVSAPGETLQEVLDDRGMTPAELADRLGMTHQALAQIIQGTAPLSHDTALKLESVLGVPASFWNRYEEAYRASLHGRNGTM